MIDFDDLDDGLKNAAATERMTAEEICKNAHMANGGEVTMPCPSCGGRGSKTYGYVNITTYPCRMCKTTGRVTQRRLDNVTRAKKAAVTERNKRDRQREFEVEHEALLEGLRKASTWSTFAASLVESFNNYGKLSEKQIAAGQSMLDKIAAKREAKRDNAPVVNVSAINALFDKAQESGLKRPKLYFGDVKISLAPANGRNAGALYVTRADDYQGKIVGGKFHAIGTADKAILPMLHKFAANPAEQARLHGVKTGVCCCCGRELTDPNSVAAGIGPICADNWGL